MNRHLSIDANRVRAFSPTAFDERGDVFEYRAARIIDAPAICDLFVRAERHDDVPRVLELDELIEELSSASADLDENSMVALDGGRIVGFVSVSHRRADAVEQRCHIGGVVDPHHRQRGIGGTLVGFAVGRSRSILEAIDDELPKYIRLQIYEYVASVNRLALALGFSPVRYFDDLLRPLTDLPERMTIEGLTLAPWPDGRDDDARITRNASFLDHWGSVPTSPEIWREQLHGFGGRPDLSFVACDASTDEIVSVLVSARYEADDTLLGRSDGWIQTLGTLREWRGTGIGTALIVEAMHAYRAAGLTHASIGVDSENPSGAARLYRGLGFEPVQRMITYQISV